MKDYQGAIADYNRAVNQRDGELDLQLVEVYNDRGLARLMVDDTDGAIADFSLAIHLDDSNHRAFYNRACACHHRGDLLGAMRDFTLALQLDPNRAEAYVNRGLIRHQLGLQQAALTDFKVASQQFHEQGNVMGYRQTLALIGRLQELLKESDRDAIA